MIKRCLDVAVPNLDTSVSAEFPFDDESEIAEWAKEAMKFCYKNNIMKGKGGGKIAPKMNTNREEGIVLLKRTYEQYKVLDLTIHPRIPMINPTRAPIIIQIPNCPIKELH